VAVREELARAQRRAGVALALLRLGGVDGADELADQVKGATTGTALAALASKLQLACSERLGDQLKKDSRLEARDLLLRVLNPFDTPPLPEAERTPCLQMHKERAEQLWTWHAGRYRYEQEDLRALGDATQSFYADWAEEYSARGRDVPEMARVEFPAAGPSPSFRDGSRQVQANLKLRVHPAAGGAPVKEVQVKGISGDETWLQVDPVPPVPVSGRDISAQLTLRLPPGAEKGGTPPLGVLVRAQVNGRSFHHKLPVQMPEPEGKRLIVLVGETRQPPSLPLTDLRLRPGVPQTAYVFVHNPGDQDQDVFVELRPDRDRTRAVRPAGSPVRVKAGATEVIPFAAASAPGKPPDLLELRGPLEIVVLDKAGNALARPQVLTVSYKQPREYIEVVASPEFVQAKNGTNRLTMQVRPVKGALTGQPCKVRMQPACKDLLRFSVDDRARSLEADSEAQTLSVGNLEFDESAPTEPSGFVYLDVDGFERALVYRMKFPGKGSYTGRELQEPELHLVAPRYLERDKPCKVVLETLNGDEGMQLEILEKRPSDMDFRKKVLLQGDRQVRRLWSPGPDGGLRFELAVQDWPIERFLDTSNLTGKYAVRVRLRQGDQTLREETRPVIVDDTRPEGRFLRAAGVEVPPKAQRRQPDGPITVPNFGLIELVAEGTDPEPETGIKEVHFFVGRPQGEQRDPKADSVRAVARSGGRWAGQLLLAPAGNTETVSVEIVNGAGMRTFDTIKLMLPPPKAANGGQNKPTTGSIAGRVTIKGRDEGLKDQKVELWDDKGTMLQESTTTNAEGRYEFSEVKPGKYGLSAKTSGDRWVWKVIAVQAGKRETADLEMSFQGK
jgi:hypothetical protein